MTLAQVGRRESRRLPRRLIFAGRLLQVRRMRFKQYRNQLRAAEHQGVPAAGDGGHMRKKNLV